MNALRKSILNIILLKCISSVMEMLNTKTTTITKYEMKKKQKNYFENNKIFKRIAIKQKIDMRENGWKI